jgi:hypothetical protein
VALREARDAEEATAEAVAETDAEEEAVTAEAAEVVTDPPEPKETDPPGLKPPDRNELFESPLQPHIKTFTQPILNFKLITNFNGN